MNMTSKLFPMRMIRNDRTESNKILRYMLLALALFSPMGILTIKGFSVGILLCVGYFMHESIPAVTKYGVIR